jgi:hypothetical protein
METIMNVQKNTATTPKEINKNAGNLIVEQTGLPQKSDHGTTMETIM